MAYVPFRIQDDPLVGQSIPLDDEEIPESASQPEQSHSRLAKLARNHGLVFLLAIHLFGGLRLLALENMPWRDAYKNMAAVAVAGAFFVACGFLLRAF